MVSAVHCVGYVSLYLHSLNNMYISVVTGGLSLSSVISTINQYHFSKLNDVK